MKNQKPLIILSLVLNLLLIAAVSFIFVKSNDLFNKEETTSEVSNTEKTNNIASINPEIAYVNLDTLLLEYKFAIELNESLLTEHARSKSNLENQLRKFEKEYNSFMEKARLGSFLSQASMESQQQKLVEKQARLQQLEQDMTQKLVIQQEEMNKELFDSVMTFIKTYKTADYKLILGNTGGANILYAEDGMDITNSVISELNIRYDATQEITIE